MSSPRNNNPLIENSRNQLTEHIKDYIDNCLNICQNMSTYDINMGLLNVDSILQLEDLQAGLKNVDSEDAKELLEKIAARIKDYQHAYATTSFNGNPIYNPILYIPLFIILKVVTLPGVNTIGEIASKLPLFVKGHQDKKGDLIQLTRVIRYLCVYVGLGEFKIYSNHVESGLVGLKTAITKNHPGLKQLLQETRCFYQLQSDINSDQHAKDQFNRNFTQLLTTFIRRTDNLNDKLQHYKAFVLNCIGYESATSAYWEEGLAEILAHIDWPILHAHFAGELAQMFSTSTTTDPLIQANNRYLSIQEEFRVYQMEYTRCYNYVATFPSHMHVLNDFIVRSIEPLEQWIAHLEAITLPNKLMCLAQAQKCQFEFHQLRMQIMQRLNDSRDYLYANNIPCPLSYRPRK